MENGNFIWTNYKDFCDGTILFSGFKEDVIKIKQHESWNLYLFYYRNTYFGVKQCAEIDYLKELSNQLDINMQTHLEACVISSMTYCVSSTTHLAQYLKPSSERNATNLLKRRSLSVIDLVIEKLKLLTHMHRPKDGETLNLDFKIALDKLPLDKSCVIYADPPYFKEHYSRYYHVLDTFVLYDYPELTYNKRMQQTTVGRYRDNRIVSDFGKKSLVHKAFDDLCDSCIKYGSKLAISYASSSLVSYEDIHKLAQSKNLYIKTLEFDLVHSGQGQARHKKVTEYLFLLSNEKF